MSNLDNKITFKSNKNILITGANSGIGFALSMEIAALGNKIIMICRNKIKGEKAKNKILEKIPNANLDLIIGDLSSIKSVNKLGNDLNEKYQTIDILIHNAGIWQMKKEMNEDGLELTFMVNYLSNFQLTYLLMPLLSKSTDPRIVLVNAGLYMRGDFQKDITPDGGNFGRIGTYCDSKFCGILFMNKFVNLLKTNGNEKIKINAIHPGVFNTNLGITNSWYGKFIRILKIPMSSPKKSTKGVLNLIFTQENETKNGKYFNIMREERIIDNAKDDKKAEELWKLSENLIKIKWE